MLGHHLNRSYKRATLIKGFWDGFERGMALRWPRSRWWAAAFQESGLADAFEGFGFQECSWSWFQVLSKLRGKTRARAPYLADRGQRSHFLRSGSSLTSHFSLSLDSTLQMSLNATFKKIRIQYFPLLIINTWYNSYKPSKYVEKLYHTLPKLYKML